MANALIVPPLPFLTVGSFSSSPGFALSNIANDYRGVIWRSGVGDAGYWIIDLGADVIIDTIMLFGVWGDYTGTATISVRTATSAQGATFAGGSVSTGQGAGNYYRFPADQQIIAGNVIAQGNAAFLWQRPAGDPSPSSVRYVHMTPFGMGPAGFIDVGRMVVGQAVRLERNFSFGASLGVRDLGSLDFNRRGVLQRTRGAKLRTLALTFSNVRRQEVERATAPLLELIGNTEMVALVTDPTPDPNLQKRCYFGPLVGDLGHTWRRADAFEAKINLVSTF